MENQLSHVLAFKDKGYLAYSKNTMSKAAHDKLREEFSKAYFPVRNQKETEATNGMMRLLSLEHLSFRIVIKTARCDKINHWLQRQIDKKCPQIFLRCESSWCLFHQSVPRSWQINFRKRVDLRKKGGYTQAISTCKHIHRAQSCEKSCELLPWF